MEYEDIDIRIGQDKKAYTVVVIHSHKGVMKAITSPYTFRISPKWANNLEAVLQVLNLRSSSQSRAQAMVKQLGEELFEQLFRDEALDLYRRVKYYAEQYKHTLRLYLHITPPQLVNYPWEILRERNLATPLCLSTQPQILLLRCTHRLIEAKSLKNPKYSSPLRILGMTSHVPDLPHLNIQHEKSVINEAVEQLQQNGEVNLTWKDGTREELANLKKDPSTWHVFHYIGHGHFDDQTGEGQLAFQDTDISAIQLSKELPASIPLIFLNACDTARGNNFERTSSVAYKLASEKRFAVIGMQFKVSDNAAVEFAKSFYTQLAAGKFIDEAVAEARQHIYAMNRNNPLDWAAPVLYTNAQKSFAFMQNADHLDKTIIKLPDTNTLPIIQLPPLIILPPEPPTPIPTQILLPPPRKTFRERFRERYRALNTWQRLLCGTMVLLLLGGIFFGSYVTLSHSATLSNTTCNINSPLLPNVNTTTSPLSVFANEPGMEISHDSYGEPVGLSNGSTIFDKKSPAYTIMLQAAQARMNDDPGSYDSLLQSAISADPTNAEAKIYAENYNVLSTHSPYITLVLGIALTPTDIGGSRDILQGANVAQKEYNDQLMQTHSNCPQLVLIIANSGSDDINAEIIANQILQLNKVNKSIVGIIGWTRSSPSTDASTVLNSSQEHILMISPNATSDLLENVPNFLRISSEDASQAKIAVNYVYNILRKKKVVIFFQDSDVYSESLENDFHDDFVQDTGNPGSATLVPYKTTAEFTQDLQKDVVQGNADLIYFSGLVGDAAQLLNALPSSGVPANVPVMGGDGLDILNDYLANQTGLNRLIFTTFSTLPPKPTAPFFSEYQNDFSTSLPPHLSNGLINLDSDVILSYEAVQVFLKGYQVALSQAKTTNMAQALENALYSIKGSQTYQGINGPIAFQQGYTDPISSVIFIRQITNNEAHIDGTFTCTQNIQTTPPTPICSS